MTQTKTAQNDVSAKDSKIEKNVKICSGTFSDKTVNRKINERGHT